MRNVTTLLFDLGGVLIELGPVAPMLVSDSHAPDEIWSRWIHSHAVRRFESGQCSADEFAAHMVEEFSLNHSEEAFLEHFASWPKQTYDGAESMISALAGRFRVLCLSNTNALHFKAFLQHQPVIQHFHRHWFSHETGVLKPDQLAFTQILDDEGLAAEEVLFLDDNPGNVQAAREIGLLAECVNAPKGVLDALERHGLSS